MTAILHRLKMALPAPRYADDASPYVLAWWDIELDPDANAVRPTIWRIY